MPPVTAKSPSKKHTQHKERGVLVLTTAEITHGGPRRTTTRTSQWYVLSVRVRVRSGQGWGDGRSAWADRMRPAISLACAHGDLASAERVAKAANCTRRGAALRSALSLSSAHPTAT